MSKINDLSNSALRKKYFDTTFVPENNLAILLIRVSGKKQERGQSIAEQMQISDAYIKKENLQLVKTWQVAESASKDHVRKHFHEMLDFIRESQKTSSPIKHVVFSFQSRSNRNRKSARELEELVDMEITLHFARDNRKLTCKSDFPELMMWHMENIKNEAFIKELTQNSMGGTIQLIERGMTPVAVPPYGLKSIGEKESRKWIPDGDKAEYIKLGFKKILEKEGEKLAEEFLTDLWKFLNKNYSYLNRHPAYKTFPHLFRNPHFYGGIRYAKEVNRGSSERMAVLVSKEDWCRVQDILDGKTRKRRLQKDGHEFEGLMRCNGRIMDLNGNLTDEICGRAVSGETSVRHYKNGNTAEFTYYRCSSDIEKHRCSQRNKLYMREALGRPVSYRQEEIEVIFEDMFKSFRFDEEMCQEMTKWLWDEHFEQKKKNVDVLGKLVLRKLQLEDFIEKSYEDKLSGKLSEDLWTKNTAKWSSEHEKIMTEMNTLKEEKEEYIERGVELIELIKNVEIIYKNASLEKKGKLVEMVSSNLLLADGTLTYEWKLPFKYLVFDDKKNPETGSGCCLEKWGG